MDLIEPKSDLETCYANEEVIRQFGEFSFDCKENAQHYDKYSQQYDMMQAATGFNDPYELVKVMIEILKTPKDSKIIDFGCGTGLLGEYLKQGGFQECYGIDGSSDMLKIAISKNVYLKTW